MNVSDEMKQPDQVVRSEIIVRAGVCGQGGDERPNLSEAFTASGRAIG